MSVANSPRRHWLYLEYLFECGIDAGASLLVSIPVLVGALAMGSILDAPLAWAGLALLYLVALIVIYLLQRLWFGFMMGRLSLHRGRLHMGIVTIFSEHGIQIDEGPFLGIFPTNPCFPGPMTIAHIVEQQGRDFELIVKDPSGREHRLSVGGLARPTIEWLKRGALANTQRGPT